MKHLLFASLVFLVACGSDNNESNNVTDLNNNTNGNNGSNNGNSNNIEPDAGTVEDAGDDEDITTFGDVTNPNNNDGCDEAAELEDAWPLNDAVAATPITSTQNGISWTSVVDASAGGSPNAANNPFIYLDLDTGAKVEITDSVAVRTDTTWDIAFRRTGVFLNSGDSGPGNVEITRLTGTSFAAVAAGDIPADSAFLIEDNIDENCVVGAPPSGFGTVVTVFEQMAGATTVSGSWFNYAMGPNGPEVVPYDDHVYIIRKTDTDKSYKFGFVSWTTGVYELQWAEL